MLQPKFQDLWDNYPDMDGDYVKQMIGGQVNADWITNTCAIRTSRALNYANGIMFLTFREN